MSKKKIFLYSFIGLISLFVVNTLETSKNDLRIPRTSSLSLPFFQNTVDKNDFTPPDLSIEKATLRKIGNPTEKFNYYTYSANVVIKNYGGDLTDAKVVLSGADQKYYFLKNSENGFSLEKEKSYIVENYDVIFDGNYNGGEIKFEINIKGQNDYYKGNNSYIANIFELPAKIENIAIEKIEDDGTFIIDYKLGNPLLAAYGTEIFTSDSLKINEDMERYSEVDTEEKIYSYYKTKNSPETVQNKSWQTRKFSDTYGYKIKFADDPWSDKTDHYVYLKTANPKNGNFAVSNILKFTYQKELERSDFAQLFVDFNNLKIINDGVIYYEDVPPESWFAPYVQTIYNLGLVANYNTKYSPERKMTRGEALRVVFDYFDVDLSYGRGLSDLGDVGKKHYLYPYIEALYANGKGAIFGGNFNPDAPATKNYLKYLIYEYKENS